MKTSVRIAAFLVMSYPCFAPAAVLVTTGTDSSGKAYVTIPTVKFTIDFWSSGINGISLDFVNVWPTGGQQVITAGAGLSFSGIQSPNVVEFTKWSSHSTMSNSLSDRDSVLQTPIGSYSYVVGDTIILQGGTFTLASEDPAFQVFAGGFYTVYLVGTVNGFSAGPISSAGVVVPEPSTLVLVGFGAVGALLWRRRKTTVALAVLANAASSQTSAEASRGTSHQRRREAQLHRDEVGRVEWR